MERSRPGLAHHSSDRDRPAATHMGNEVRLVDCEHPAPLLFLEDTVQYVGPAPPDKTDPGPAPSVPGLRALTQ